MSSYYEQPILKEPIWTWEIPCYFFAGGLGGASAALAYAAELHGNEVLASRSRATSLVALSLSPAFLISDLGRPARFLNMFRMFKVTSPMSVGSWLLGAGWGGDRVGGDRHPAEAHAVGGGPARPSRKHVHSGADRRHRDPRVA